MTFNSPIPPQHDVEQETPLHDVADLMNGGRVAFIQNNGMTYTLRITRAGKLILTK